MAATCELCEREMNGQGCTHTHIRFALNTTRDGDAPKHIIWSRYYKRQPVVESYAGCTECHDCAARVGLLHHDRCDMERCPSCRGQLLSCDCSDIREYSLVTRQSAPKVG